MTNTKGFARNKIWLSTAVLASGLVLATNAYAQDAPQSSAAAPQSPTAAPPATSQTDTAVNTNDIVVTANRTSTLASKTPITLTAVSGAGLADAGISNPTQLAAAVPGITVQRGNASALLINIRGVQSTGGTPSVAFLINGVYIADGAAQEVSLYDINRIEVLRGPQGTLYGRNTPAGVVNIISNTPTNTLGGSFEIGYGSYDALQSTAVLNLPASDKLAFRLAANWEMRDSYYKSAVPDLVKPIKDRNNKSARLSMLFKPTDSFKALIVADYSRIAGDGSNFGLFPLISRFYQVPLAIPAAGQLEPNPVYIDPSSASALTLDVNHQFQSRSNDYTWGIAGTFDWNITGNLTATYQGSYRRLSQDDAGTNFFGSQLTGSTATNDLVIDNLVLPISMTQKAESQSHELRLAYDSSAFKAQGGLYYFRQTSDQFYDFTFFTANNPDSYQESRGIFGQATYSLTPRWRVTAGARYSSDKSGTPTARTQNSKLTWKIDTDFDLSSSVMAYATVATGYKQGSINQNCAQITVPCTVLPEAVTDFEAGLKGRYFGGKLATNIAVFHYNYSNLQISQVVPLLGNLGATVATTNAAAAKIDGVELEGSYTISPQSKFDFTAAYLNARYTNFAIAPSVPTTGNYNGEPLDHSPKWTLTAGYTFIQPIGNGDLTANIRTRYTAKYVMLNEVANTFFVQPGFTKTNFSLRYNAPGNVWFLEGYVRNIENKVEVNYVNTAPLFGSGLPWNNNGKVSTGDPRTYGFRAGFKF
jgi:iron complex outermembrane receptor protein